MASLDLSVGLLTSQLVVEEGSRVYDAWAADPVTTTFSVYLFNYTNVQRFQDGVDEKLNLVQVGPYSYTVTSTKVNIVFNDNGTVSYQERKIFHYAPHLSNGSVDDIINIPNIPHLTALSDVKNEGFMLRYAMEVVLSTTDSTLFYSIKVNEILWGYSDPLIQFASQYPTPYAFKLMKYFPGHIFGLFHKMNGTQENLVTIHTGKTDVSKKGLLDQYNGQRFLTHWPTTQCNSLEAYPSSALPPYLNKTIYLYWKDACRRVPMVKTASSQVRGILTSRYELPTDIYSNTGDNSCFCSKHRCESDGVLDISACAYGGPIFASKPHFLHGAAALSKLFDGLQPDRDAHTSYLDIESNIGFILNGRTSGQLNVQLRRGISTHHRFPDHLILPVTWISVTTDEMPPAVLWEVRGAVTLFNLAHAVIYVGIPALSAVGLAVLLL